MYNNRIIMTGVFLMVTQAAFCQKAKDTAALIAIFNKVMSFAEKPYVHYTTTTTMQANPVLQPEDTAVYTGEFYKKGNNLYFNNGAEETFREDSLMVHVNGRRKSIWINKTDTMSKMQFNAMADNYPIIRQIMEDGYVVTQSQTGKASQLNFVKEKTVRGSTMKTGISLSFDPKTLLPIKIDVEIAVQQPTNEDQIASMKSNGINTGELIKTINNTKYIVRSQSMVTEFKNIVFTEEKTSAIPQWKDKVQYSAANGFAGKGKLQEYEVTKTF